MHLNAGCQQGFFTHYIEASDKEGAVLGSIKETREPEIKPGNAA